MGQLGDECSTQLLSTGIPGLDEILRGGFPRNHLYVLEGESGTGKTTLAMQFLREGQRRGERGLFITLSDTEHELRTSAASHGWSLDGIEILNLTQSTIPAEPGQRYTFFSPADVEMEDTIQVVMQAIERSRPERVVFDPFSDFRLLAQDTLRYRRQVLALRDFLSKHGCTAILIQDANRNQALDPQAEGLVHGYITMHAVSPEYGRRRRRLQVQKLRGVPFRDGYHDFDICTGGLVVYPRLIAGEHLGDYPEELVSSDLSRLDTLLGGGLARGSSVLLVGSAGVGKSTLSTQYALAAARRGETAAIFLFEETVRTSRARGDGLGMQVSEAIASGKLHLRQVDPAELSLGGFVELVRTSVEKEGARIVVVDSLHGLHRAMPAEEYLTTELHELLTYLSHRGVLTFITLGQQGIVTDSLQSPIDVSYLSDTILLLRYFEAFGEVRRCISVVKKRSGPHRTTLHELILGSPSGVDVSEPLDGFENVLTGRPSYQGPPEQLATLPTSSIARSARLP